MGVDSVDLIQLHNLVEPEELEVAHGPGGAVEGARFGPATRASCGSSASPVTARASPTRHLHSIERFDVDSVLLPYNHLMMQDPMYRAVVRDAGRAVQRASASPCRRSRRSPAAAGRTASVAGHRSWYEPLPEGAALERAVAFVLGRPGLFLNTSSDATLLRPILAAAERRAGVPSDEEMDADVREHDMHALFDGAALERI